MDSEVPYQTPYFQNFHMRFLVVLPASPEVTMIQDSACKQDKPPFDSYGDLTAAGVDVKLADLQNGGPEYPPGESHNCVLEYIPYGICNNCTIDWTLLKYQKVRWRILMYYCIMLYSSMKNHLSMFVFLAV